jgi:hypothetical protein
LMQMRQGTTNHRAAGTSSSLLEASLNVSGRDSMLGLSPFSYTGLTHAFDGHKQKEKKEFDGSIAPTSVYHASVADPAALVHPGMYQAELREVAQRALDDTAKFLAKTHNLNERALVNSML